MSKVPDFHNSTFVFFDNLVACLFIFILRSEKRNEK